jgi:aminopeptidase YwaD
MKKALLLCLIIPQILFAGDRKKEKKELKQLQADITYLASDDLEGRRTGTIGERIAAHYIAKRLLEAKLLPYFNESFLQKFQVKEGRELGIGNTCFISDQEVNSDDYTPMPFSGNGTISELILTKVIERGTARMIPASDVTQKKLNNPHDNALEEYLNKANQLIKEGARGIVFYNDISEEYDYTFNEKLKADTILNKVVVYINYKAYKALIKPMLKKDWVDVSLEVNIVDKIREGYNVAGFINNNAKYTVVLGAHFDHLGYGEDHNSLKADTIPAIHNGADDNASGVAALLALAKRINEGKNRQYNYLFVAFSGEELGLFGSKKFIEMNENRLKNINYMINMDMVGRYDETKKALTIGGVGTSPTWIPTIERAKKFFVPKWDSAGVGPSDHTSFYMKNIPVLFFFTGLHTDYHKPSDDADKINYKGEVKIIDFIEQLTVKMDKEPKLLFTKTKEPKQEGARFKVTLGIMPDYTYSGNGVKADGVTDGKLAQRIGMQAGDVIVQLGDYKIRDMQGYMEALSKFKENDSTTVVVERGKELKTFKVVFAK